MSELRPQLEEILETLWVLTEDRDQRTASFDELYKELLGRKKFSEELTKSLLEELISLKFIEINNDRNIILSQKGYVRARQIIRFHRLYERLFSDVLRMEDNTIIENSACVLEHIISADVEESVCTLLGHPKTCPHGFKIPPGPCCEQKISTVSSIIVPVTELDIGESGPIAYITSKDNREMNKLLAFGILPGNILKMHQKMPFNGPIVVQIDETQLALEKSIADQISVRRGKRKHHSND
ncbi:MAG: metal-dependent transcriptional regulator [Promethearchaeota archaeon]